MTDPYFVSVTVTRVFARTVEAASEDAAAAEVTSHRERWLLLHENIDAMTVVPLDDLTPPKDAS